jgi:copper oxidase (laccase) domain-containing protein
MGVAPELLLTAYQVHSPDVVAVSRAFEGDRPRADALVTDRPGIALGVSTADCGPVLFADAEASVIGAAHAGWKGAFTGVLENTVAAMERLGA